MASEIILANPLGWAQIRLLGGWRRICFTTGIYAGALLLFNVFIFRMLGGNVTVSEYADKALIVMTFIELATIIFLGAGAIKKAVHRDFTSDMISSHRQTDIGGHSAVIGYLVGATAQVLSLTVVNWLTCTILAALTGTLGTSIAAPTLILGVFGCLALFCWTLAILIGLSTRGGSSVAALVALVIVLANFRVISVLPGAALLIGYTTIRNLSAAVSGGIQDVSIIVTMMAQCAFAITFFVAAARKFARDDVQAFSPLLAFVLLAEWTLICAVALAHWPAPGLFGVIVAGGVQSIATIVAMTVIAFLPLASAARASAIWHKRRAHDPEFTKRRPLTSYVAPLIAWLLIAGITTAVFATPVARGTISLPGRLEFHPENLLYIAGTILLALLGISGLLRFTYAKTPKALFALIVFLVLFWAVPPLADVALAVAEDRLGTDPVSPFFGCSPIGTWILMMAPDIEGPIWIGIGFQGLVAAAAISLGIRQDMGRRAGR